MSDKTTENKSIRDMTLKGSFNAVKTPPLNITAAKSRMMTFEDYNKGVKGSAEKFEKSSAAYVSRVMADRKDKEALQSARRDVEGRKKTILPGSKM